MSKDKSPSECVKGVFIKERYIKCPHMQKHCNWRLGPDHGDCSYLNNACYLSGSSKLECPE